MRLLTRIVHERFGLSGIRYAIVMLRREWRAGDLRIVALALVLAVACATSVAAFTDRLQQALQRQGGELLAADLVVRSSFPTGPAWREKALSSGLAVARTTSMRSVVVAGRRTHLVEIKAVGSGYPLRGELRVATRDRHHDIAIDSIPPPGHVWIDPQLSSLLDIAVGDTIEVGAAAFQVTRILTFEPDRGGAAFVIAPRLLMHESDLDKTQLLQPGSLATYRLLLAGTPQPLSEFRRWLEPQLTSGVSIRDVTDAGPRFRLALERAQRFLSLAALVGVLLAGVAIAQGAWHYTERNLDHAAMLRCLGWRQRDVLSVYVYQQLLLGLGAGSFGAMLGYAGQQVLVHLLPALTQGDLPAPSWRPALAGIAVGIVTLSGFSLPVVARLKQVPPLRVLRRDLGRLPPQLYSLYGFGAAMFLGLTILLARDWRIVAYVLGGTTLTVAGLAGASYVLLRLLGRLKPRAGSGVRHGLLSLVRRTRAATIQAVALGVGIMAILLLTVVRGDLLRNWENRLPAGTPNHFIVNIQPGQIAAVREFLDHVQGRNAAFKPLVRARLMSINGKVARAADFDDPFAQRMMQRAANLSWVDDLGDDNRIVAGRWSDPNGDRMVVSVEQEYAAALGMQIGDILTYRVGDRDVALRIASLRAVSWDSFRPNFFLLTPADVLGLESATFIGSVFVPPANDQYVTRLVEQFPNLTDIDIGAILDQVRRLLQRLNHAMQFVFLFTVGSGLLVLYASIYSSQRERRAELGLLRALGAARRYLWASLASEFIVLGALAGSIGALAASLTGLLIARGLLNLDYQFSLTVWLMGISVGALLVTAVGLAGTHRLIATPPWHTLRGAA